MSENFLNRWSKRKLEVRAQEKLADEVPVMQAKVPLARVDAEQGAAGTELATTKPLEQPVPQPELPLPTEEDLDAVKQGGDIKAFMVDKVSTELKNKAFNALFSRPEFNVMDGLDIYIDDYSKFTPLSQEDIAKMTFSKQLLSRPDLDIPKLDEIQAEVKELVSTVQNPVQTDDAVLEKESVEEFEKADEDEGVDGIRVIPDGSQAIDSEQLPTKQSFENVEQKLR